MPEPKSYTVSKKEEHMRFTPEQGTFTVIRFWATSKGGTYFHVDVPEDQLDKAPQLLEAKAKKLDAVQ